MPASARQINREWPLNRAPWDPQHKALAQDPRHVRTVAEWMHYDQGCAGPKTRTSVVAGGCAGVRRADRRYGSKPITFEKGKSVIVVASKDQLVATIDTVIGAVRTGELDEHLAAQAKARGVPKSTRAA